MKIKLDKDKILDENGDLYVFGDKTIEVMTPEYQASQTVPVDEKYDLQEMGKIIPFLFLREG